MGNNIIQYPGTTVIICGGNGLKDCPKDWDEAKIIETKLNEGKGDYEPKWSFDCGFKLDYDGGIVSISSRFYPPKTHYGETWDGAITLYLMGKEINKRKFDCETLDILKKEVDNYINELSDKIKQIIF